MNKDGDLMKLSELLTLAHFEQAYQKVAENKGGPGVDGISITTFTNNLTMKLTKLIDEIKNNQYRCQPCKAVKIPKNKGAFRQLAIPTIRDRIVQTVLSQALVPFFEPHFEKCSWGYRPERSYLNAVKQIEIYRDQGFQYVLDADIKSYFEHIPQSRLMEELSRYIQCDDMINLIKNSLLQMQFLQNNQVYGAAKGLGVPQGSPLSPVLANMYLDPLDEALLSQAMKVVRYADDFIVLTKTPTEAGKALKIAKDVLTSYQLHFNAEKTRVTDFESGFVFLGQFFIGNLVQPLSNESKKLTLSTWQWDDLSLQVSNEKQIHAFSGEIIKESSAINVDCFAELQQEILDSQSQLPIQIDESDTQNLICKLRTLYLAKQGSVVHKIAGKYEVRFGGETLQQIPITQLDCIMCFGVIHLTRAVIVDALQLQLPIIMLTQTGHWQGMISGNNLPDVTLLQQQLAHFNSPLPIAKEIVTTKINNCIVVLKRRMRSLSLTEQLLMSKALKSLLQAKQQAKQVKTLHSLRGIEGNAARNHFALMRALIPEFWQFNTRNRRPPKDPINALLSLGYTILFNNIIAFIQLRKLTLNIAFLHNSYSNQPSLALDLMEPFRAPIVDSLVIKMALSRAISINDFSLENNACLISAKAKEVFIAALEDKLAQQITYPALNRTTEYRRIMDLQTLLLKQSLLNPTMEFKPFRIR